ncbi:MAG TPA: hypothetical protein VK358_15650 [Longimicrobium sp.]|nr:hypothetical protein [Longimicrobium sp.]
MIGAVAALLLGSLSTGFALARREAADYRITALRAMRSSTPTVVPLSEHKLRIGVPDHGPQGGDDALDLD